MDMDENRPTSQHIIMKFERGKNRSYTRSQKSSSSQAPLLSELPEDTAQQSKKVINRRKIHPRTRRLITEQKRSEFQAEEEAWPGKTAVLRSYRATNPDQIRAVERVWQRHLQDETERIPEACAFW